MSQSINLDRWRTRLPKLQLVQNSTTVASSLIREICGLSHQELCGAPVQDEDVAEAAQAGLLLLAGGLEEAHRIVQELETPEAYYWHGIVHRREPDWSNAKYWFRRLGHHAVFDQITDVMKTESMSVVKTAFSSDQWDPLTFVDLCQECANSDEPELLQALLMLQQCESEQLLEHCLRQAVR